MRNWILMSLLAGLLAACDSETGASIRLPEISAPEAPTEESPEPITEEQNPVEETTPVETNENTAVEAPAEVTTPDPVEVMAPEPVEVVVPDPETESAAVPSPDIVSSAELVDHDGDSRVPSTNKLVRGARNGAELSMKTGETFTLALNANRDLGFVWHLEGPVGRGTGLRFIADYYRDGESPFFDRGSTGGARYFQFEAEAPGSFPLTIKHMDGETVRATKSVTLVVTE